jgi:hypothetical protein
MTDTTTELLSAIKSLDLTIRELTEAVKASAHRPTPAPTYTPPKASQTKAAWDEEVPQPAEIIANAGEVLIHFGKRNGEPLSQLPPNSLRWYATDQEPRLNNQGEPFPPRPQEVTLKNAARTLWHMNKGTLVCTELPQRATPAAPAANTSQGNIDEDVAF